MSFIKIRLIEATLAKNSDNKSERGQKKHGFIPSFMPDNIGRGADDELEKALAAPPNEDKRPLPKTEKIEERRPSILLHALAILFGTLVWGLIAGLIWPVTATIAKANFGVPDALAEIRAMSGEEISVALDAWSYLTIGAPIIVLAGLTIAGVAASVNRLKHVFSVAIIIWLLNTGAMFLQSAALEHYIFSLIKYSIMALVAYWLSHIFKKSESTETR